MNWSGTTYILFISSEKENEVKNKQISITATMPPSDDHCHPDRLIYQCMLIMKEKTYLEVSVEMCRSLGDRKPFEISRKNGFK